MKRDTSGLMDKLNNTLKETEEIIYNLPNPLRNKMKNDFENDKFSFVCKHYNSLQKMKQVQLSENAKVYLNKLLNSSMKDIKRNRSLRQQKAYLFNYQNQIVLKQEFLKDDLLKITEQAIKYNEILKFILRKLSTISTNENIDILINAIFMSAMETIDSDIVCGNISNISETELSILTGFCLYAIAGFEHEHAHVKVMDRESDSKGYEL